MEKKRTLERGIAGLLVLVMVLTMVPVVGAPAVVAQETAFIINEVDSDTPSYDMLEFIELYDGGVGSMALDGLVVVLFNGNGDTSYLAFDLDGYATDAGGYFVIGSVAEADIYVDPGSQGWLQNGADAVALYSGDASDFPNGTAVTTDNLLDALVYDTNDSDDTGLLILLNEGQAQINEGGSGDKDNQSNQRCPNGEGGARNTSTYIQSTPTPGAANNCELPPPPFIINEVDSDTPSYDKLEFIELYDGGVGSMALDGLVVVLFNGSNDGAYDAFDLDGFATNADGYFVIGSVAEADIYVDPGSSGWLQNGADAVALYSGDATGFPDGTLVTTDGLIDALVYDTDDADDAGLLVLLNPGQPQINENGLGNKDNQSNQRCPNGEGGARNTNTYTQFTPSPGATNCELPPEQCGDPYTFIYWVQGDGSASPLVGTEVAVEGVVVGDFQNNGVPDNGDLNGFHIQDPDGDGEAVTSDGVFVYAPGGMDVALGDAVRVRGVVSEYRGLTEITASQIWSCGTGSVAPTAISLPMASPDAFERYEGMLVTFPQDLVISEYYNFDRYGEIVLTSKRLDQPTAVYDPGSPEAAELAAENALDRITLDDGRTSQNPDPAIHPNGLVFALTNLFRGGDTVANVTGVVDYYYGYKIQPTMGADYVNANPRTEAPDDVGGNLKVASFNVLNYFTTLGSRGADTPEEFTRQRDKIFAALAVIDADVVGLIEIENNGTAVADLVEGLNDVVGEDTYDYVHTGVVGDDEITVALIYKPATVSLVGGYAVLDASSFTDPLGYDDQQSRPALAQSFMDKTTGGIFTAVVNHLKSKSCYDYATGGDLDLGDGQSCFNETRTQGAQELVNWLATDPTGSEDADVLIIGDLNAYDKEDPIDVLVAGGYADQILAYRGEHAYSYVFDGQIGYLDHALANGDLTEEITGVTVWHINADEPDLIDYDMSYKADAQDAIYAPDPYRSSDHDPVIAGLAVCDEIAPAFDEVSVDRDMLWPPNHKYVDVTATVVVSDNFDQNPTVTLVSVESDEPDYGLDDEDVPEDIVIVGDFNFKLRAERWDEGDGRTYTITYRVTDACGNSTEASVTVTVPHDQRKEK
jgi:predicted extracellular nuclease